MPGPWEIDLPAVVDEINAREGSSWSVIGRLKGGYSAAGAFELRDGSGARAVLKPRAPKRTAGRVAATAAAVEEARRKGWPTPRWLVYGVIEGVAEYIVTEMIEDAGPFDFTDARLDMLVAASRIQADLDPAIEADWSAYITRIVFEGERGLGEQMRSRPETQLLWQRLEAANSPARDVVLPATDLVHGDFASVNILVSRERLWLIDAEFSGRGTRAYDLATFFLETAVGNGPYLSADRANAIRSQCVDLVGDQGLLVCVTARLLDWLSFGIEHWPARLSSATQRCHRFLDGLDVPR